MSMAESGLEGMQIAPTVLTTFPYGNSRLSVWGHLDNPNRELDQRKFFVMPLVMFIPDSVIYEKSVLTEQTAIHFDVQMWNENIMEAAVSHLRRVTGHVDLSSEQVATLPVEQVRLVWVNSEQPLSNNFKFNNEWQSYAGQHNVLQFSMAVGSPELCSSTVERLRQCPKHLLGSVELQYVLRASSVPRNTQQLAQKENIVTTDVQQHTYSIKMSFPTEQEQVEAQSASARLETLEAQYGNSIKQLETQIEDCTRRLEQKIEDSCTKLKEQIDSLQESFTQSIKLIGGDSINADAETVESLGQSEYQDMAESDLETLQTEIMDYCTPGILLIGGYDIEGGNDNIEYYNQLDECSLAEKKSAMKIRRSTSHTSGCYLAATNQIIVRDGIEPNRPPFLYGLSDGSTKKLPTPYKDSSGEPGYTMGTTTASISPSKCISCGGWARKDGLLNSCYLFDVTETEWTTLSPMPEAMVHAASVYLKGNNSFYVMGGGVKSDTSNKLYRYDVQQDSWQEESPMTEERVFHAAAPLSDTEFIVGGGNCSDETCAVYDASTGVWRTVANFNVGRSAHALVNFDNDVYALGGAGDDGKLTSVEMFDRSTESWKLVKELKHARDYFVAVVI